MTLVAEMLEKATKAATGEQVFWIMLGAEPRPLRININPDSRKILAIRTKAAQLAKMKEKELPVAWKPFWQGGIDTPTATRIAYAEGCELSIYPQQPSSAIEQNEPTGDPERFSTLDLLQMARQAGSIFLSITDEVVSRMNGIRSDIEVEAIEDLGED